MSAFVNFILGRLGVVFRGRNRYVLAIVVKEESDGSPSMLAL